MNHSSGLHPHVITEPAAALLVQLSLKSVVTAILSQLSLYVIM